MRRQNKKTLRAVMPNAGIEAAYRRRLLRLVDEMGRSVEHWLTAAYRANEPAVMALDDSSSAMREAIRRLIKQWQDRFDEAADDLARYFGRSVTSRTDAQLRAILKKGGWSVKFRMTPAARDILKATVAENVSLIRSIPSENFTKIEGMVMRSVKAGRDLETLGRDLREQFGVTRRRAQLIARDQNNKATGQIVRARQLELGITEAVWQHSGGGKKPRRTHVKNSGKRYDVAKGWFDPDEKKWIHPGELINCRCVSRSVVPGFS